MNNNDNYGQQEYGQMNGAYGQQPYMGGGYEYGQKPSESGVFNLGSLFGILSAILLFLGMMLPIIDFSAFDENVDIQYNLIKVCKNVGLISSAWTGIPYGLGIAAVAMLVLSFVRLPMLRFIPCVIVVGMIVIMIADVGNIVEWAKDTLERYYSGGGISVDGGGVTNSIMYGAYFLGAGLVMGIISCFLGNKKTAA